MFWEKLKAHNHNGTSEHFNNNPAYLHLQYVYRGIIEKYFLKINLSWYTVMYLNFLKIQKKRK